LKVIATQKYAKNCNFALMMKEEIQKAVEVLKRGGLLLYPTDTVWGIGCNATNEEAVARIYALKRSADKHAMTVLVASTDDVGRYVKRVPEVAWQLLEVADTPLTIIYPGGCGIAPNLIPDTGTIGIRVPKHDFCQALLRRLGRPLVSTSANISGEATPLNFDAIPDEIRAGVDMVVSRNFEGHPTGKPSSIIMLGEGGEIKIIRE
jgi:L-threonylcarbamoyladenylate synthase